MSFFTNWFSKKKTEESSRPAEHSDLGSDATVPLMPGVSRQNPIKIEKTVSKNSATERKNIRLEHREKLYVVVRESLLRAGVLSSGYKFKVLSLDQSGRQYMIMIDMAHEYAHDSGRLAEIEALIAQNAKRQHEILVSAVYWRVNEQVTAGLSGAKPSVSEISAVPAPVDVVNVEPKNPVLKTGKRFEPIREDEVAAFKRALASGVAAAPLVASGEIVKTGPRKLVQRDFEDTEVVDPQERVSPLSSTQYGELK